MAMEMNLPFPPRRMQESAEIVLHPPEYEQFDPSSSGVVSLAFIRGSPNSEWCAALGRRDCKTLLTLVSGNQDLWAEIDPNGRTVLHVAVIQGCSQLARKVLSFPNSPSSLDMLMNAKDKSTCDANAFSLAKIVGNTDVLNIIKNGRHSGGRPADRDPDQPQGPVGTYQGHEARNLQAYQGREARNLQAYQGHEARNLQALSRIIQEVLGDQDSEIRSILNRRFEDDVDYNFVELPQNLLFLQDLLFLHVGCKQSQLWDSFLQRVIERTKRNRNQNGDENGNDLLQALFEFKDPQGRTILHVAVEEDGLGDKEHDLDMAAIIKMSLGILGGQPVPNDDIYKKCVNARDFAGRTPLHRAVANKRAGSAVIKALVNHDKTDVNALWTSLDERITGNVTALHLAVLHNNLDAAKFLLAKKETNGEIKCKLFIEASGFRSSKDSEPKLSGRNWTALELAIIMGHVHMVALLLKARRTLYTSRCIHLAAARGDPESLRNIIDAMPKRRDLIAPIDGVPPLHFAVHATPPSCEQGDKINQFLFFDNYVNVYGLEQTRAERCKVTKMTDEQGLASQEHANKCGCINLLLRYGVDILQVDGQRKFADPGFGALDTERLWWYEMITKETVEAKKKLVASGSTTLIVATLVASASFAGQFRLPYDAPYASARASIATTSISFYFAIFSIMFAILPSFFHSHVDLVDEPGPSKKCVTIAVLCVLISFISFILSYIFLLQYSDAEDYGSIELGVAIYYVLFCLDFFFGTKILSSMYRPFKALYKIVKD